MIDPSVCTQPPDSSCLYDEDVVECCAACPYSCFRWPYYEEV